MNNDNNIFYDIVTLSFLRLLLLSIQLVLFFCLFVLFLLLNRAYVYDLFQGLRKTMVNVLSLVCDVTVITVT